VPEEDYVTPIGEAAVVRAGRDITIVGWGVGVHQALESAQALAGQGIEAEVIDLRTLAPLDRGCIVTSVGKTGRLVVIDDDYRSCGVAAEVIATVCETPGLPLRSAPCRITFPDVPVPFAPQMERPLLPDAAKITAAARAQF
jgi:acetoin:2,6-dichlorophenolindophenol oxidoreductase subunit beta